MTKKFLVTIVALIAIIGLVVAGCPTEIPDDPDPPAPPPPERTTGPWLDRIIIREETSVGAGIAKLQANEIQMWHMLSISDPALFETISEDPNLKYEFSYGGFTELMFNVAGPYFNDGRLNPFADAQIREAFNWLIDRDYFVGELLGGLGEPIYALAGAAFPEYVRYPDLLGAIEDKYAHDPDKANAIIAERMGALGAELVGGKWHYDEEAVEIKFIIRIDLYRPLYPAGGEYIADLMEAAGFTVDRMLLTGPEAFGIWIPDDPADGTYSAYTGGWGITAIPRDEGGRFYASDTKFLRPWPRWLALDPPEEYLEVAERLYDRDYTTLAERKNLFEQALTLRMEYSPQILLADIGAANPWRAELQVRTDLSYGFGWGVVQTLAYLDEDGNPTPGGDVFMDQYFVLSEPWNPVDGSGASADLAIFRNYLQEGALMVDGRDGLYWPWHASSAAVTIKQGLPVGKTMDWMTLTFAPEIVVPPDAWADWDPVEQRFITVAEKYPDGMTVNRKSVITYPASLWDVPMHDGSTLHIVDFLMSWIMSFDRAKEESPIYDEGDLSRYEAMMRNFRGVKILSVNPLIIESYSNLWYLDAEWNISTWFPSYGIYGQFAPWHVIAVGWMAEADGRLAWSTDKAAKLEREWMDYTKGPSLAWLAGYTEDAIADAFIPYADFLSQYITEEEIVERYQNLRDWYGERGHFWTTTAPFYLHSVSPVAGIIDIRRFEDHPDPIDRWDFLLDPYWY